MVRYHAQVVALPALLLLPVTDAAVLARTWTFIAIPRTVWIVQLAKLLLRFLELRHETSSFDKVRSHLGHAVLRLLPGKEFLVLRKVLLAHLLLLKSA